MACHERPGVKPTAWSNAWDVLNICYLIPPIPQLTDEPGGGHATGSTLSVKTDF